MKRRAITAVVLALSSAAFAQDKVPAPAAPASAPQSADLAYGAFERGFFITAFKHASELAQQNDATAMTLLGELYAQGLGIPRDDVKAAPWYRAAADRGDANAMFSLAMFAMQGRGGVTNQNEAVRLLEQAAKLKHPLAA